MMADVEMPDEEGEEGGEEEIEDRVEDLEDAHDELNAEFEELMAGDAGGEDKCASAGQVGPVHRGYDAITQP